MLHYGRKLNGKKVALAQQISGQKFSEGTEYNLIKKQ